MGIFSKQGPYQEFKPLFVKEFNADNTIKTLNDKYADFDNSKLINKSPALTYEQQEADKIHTAHQDIINKAVSVGELDPWKAKTMVTSLAHDYVNDTDRLKYQRSNENDEISQKEQKDNANLAGARLKALGKHSYIGGSKNQVLNQYVAPKEVDENDYLKTLSSLFNANVTDDITQASGNGMMAVSGTKHESITKKRVSEAANALFNNEDLAAQLEAQAYSKLNDPTINYLANKYPSLTEKDLRAKAYEMLNTPEAVVQKEHYVKDGKTLTRSKTIYLTPLEQDIQKAKHNMVKTAVGTIAYDKWDKSLTYHNLPDAEGSGEDVKNPYDIVAGTIPDFTNPYGKSETENPLSEEVKSGFSTFAGLGSNVATAMKNFKTWAEAPDSELDDKSYGTYSGRRERANESVATIRKALADEGVTVNIEDVNEDTSNSEEVEASLNKAVVTLNSIAQQRKQTTILPTHTASLKDVVSNLDPTAVEIKYTDASGKLISGKTLASFASEYPDMTTKEMSVAERTKYVKDNLVINGIVSNKGATYFRGSFGDKEMLVKIPLLNATHAFDTFNSFTTLTTSKLRSLSLPLNSYLRNDGKYNKIVKHQTVMPDGTVQLLYSLSNGKNNNDDTTPISQTDFYNKFLQHDMDLNLKNKQLKQLFNNSTVKKEQTFE